MQFSEPPHRYCKECKTEFASSFELVDHYLEDDEDFDPYYLLPNGLKLMLGSLMRYFYGHADNPDKIKLVSQSTYMTLFASELGGKLAEEVVEDMIVKAEMQDFEEQLNKMLKGKGNGGISNTES